MFDMDKMEAGLNELTGMDFEQAENAERMNGNMMPDISFSKSLNLYHENATGFLL